MNRLLRDNEEAAEDWKILVCNEKSETRVLIEKFVDENPEAVAVVVT